MEKNGSISYERYRRVFESENIGFGKPSQDECDVCLSYNQHSSDSSTDHNAETCLICTNAKAHLERARKARSEYSKDDSSGSKIYTADMQKIILLPKLTSKQHFFVSRLVTFNETFACINDPSEPDRVILWHEAISGRSAADVASAYLKCIELSASDNVTFWVDNCSGQNKNWTLYTAMCQCVNAAWGPQEVTLKYLEKGHTYMKADSIHGSIGKKMKTEKQIVNFQDFVDICSHAGKHILPVVMKVTDFRDFVGQQRTRKTKKCTLPLLADICVANFKKGSRALNFKTDFDRQYQSVDFLKPKFSETALPERKFQMRGIPSGKKDEILKLLDGVPSSKKRFWLDLPSNDGIADLVENFD